MITFVGGVSPYVPSASTNGTCATVRDSRLPLHLWDRSTEGVHVPAEQDADEGE